jgi:hypothetical protein
MSTILSQAEPGFFGKDDFVPFIGQVEDVNDPKRSNRVRVRCLGFHVENKNGDGGVKTENLPWAKVAMPATHSQQVGVGGKHGLQPTSWVWGFFLDGKYCQKPMVCGTFNFTAKASDKDNRLKEASVDGKVPETVEPYSKVNPLFDTTFPNKGLVSYDESGDIAHDTSKDDSGDGDCPIERSIQTEDREDEKDKQRKQEGQIYDTIIPDGICGSVTGARDDINNFMKQAFPESMDRFTYGDLVWDAMSGDSVNLNGILSKLSGLICDSLKQSIQSNKALQEKIVNRKQMSSMEGDASDRDGMKIQLVEQTIDLQQDTWHTAFAKLLDGLCDQVMGMLQGMNNQQKSPEGQNNTGVKGTKSKTKISNVSSLCITDTLINNVAILMEKTLQEANELKDENLSGSIESINKATTLLENLDPADFTCRDDMAKKVDEEIKKLKGKEDSDDSGGGSSSGSISDSLGLSDISQFISVMTDLKFTQFPEIFNKAGLGTLDPETKEGCNPSRLYNTATSAMGSMAGVAGAFTGGGSESGKSSKNSKDLYKNMGFGGKPGATDMQYTDTVCDEAFERNISDGERQRILNSLLFWVPVDYHDPNRNYDLIGEVEFNGRRTSNSRVLVSNQTDPTENGIYITSNQEWRRSSDADEGREFTENKIVTVKNVPVVDEYWVYTGDDKPRLDASDIKFTRLFYSKTEFESQTGTIGIGADTRPNLSEGVGSPGNDIDQFLLISEEVPEKIGIALDPFIKSKPSGFNGRAIAISLPTGDVEGAKNFIQGIPNIVCIVEPGKDYFFTREDEPTCAFPSIYIPGYVGTPTPVIDPSTGEFVAILTLPQAFDTNPSPSVSLIPDTSCLGIRSDDENYDIVVGGIYVSNTGFEYSDDVVVELYDRDREVLNGEARAVVIEGRIVEVQLINNGTGYKRIPEVRIKDKTGYGARLYPIMNVVQRVPGHPEVKPLPTANKVTYCPAKNQFNLLQPKPFNV